MKQFEIGLRQMVHGKKLMLRCATKTPTRVKEIVANNEVDAEVVEVHRMTGVEAMMQISVPLLGVVGSLASIVALWRELSQSSETKVTHIVVVKDGEKVAEQDGNISAEDLSKILADVIDDEK